MVERQFSASAKIIFSSFILGLFLTLLVLAAGQMLLPRDTNPVVSVAVIAANNEQAVENLLPQKQAVSVPALAPKVESVAKVPVYRAHDFLMDYLSNRNYPIIVEGTPWNNGSTNVFQYQDKLGGNSFWDFWGEDEPWDSPYHMYQDDDGKWRTYKQVILRDTSGKPTPGYILVERRGPGVMEKLWFTHDTTGSFLSLLDPFGWWKEKEPPELTEWGNLQKLGNLRIDVDDRIVYDGPIRDWFSGDAQHLPLALKKIFVWRFQDYGSNGNLIPIPYQKNLRVLTYGGASKPKWFAATGVTLPPGARVQAYTNSINDLTPEAMVHNADNVLAPEKYLATLDNTRDFKFDVRPGSPASIKLDKDGTLGAIQFRVPKSINLKPLRLTIKYGGEIGMDLPFLAFFGEADRVSLHHSTPIGIIEDGDAYLFYSNFPMPYHNGIEILLSSDASFSIPVSARLAMIPEMFNTQLRVQYNPPERLQVYGKDYQVKIPGDGKVVGLVLVTKDQEYDKIPKLVLPDGKEDPKGKFWPMGYLEGNLTLFDGTENFRLYPGHEDWTDGGFYFNNGYTAPTGGSNRPFGGILQYKNAKDGYATLFRYFNDLSAFRFKNGLLMNLGHGTHRNNFAVKYGLTVFYYKEIPGLQRATLPAFRYISAVEASALNAPCDSFSRTGC